MFRARVVFGLAVLAIAGWLLAGRASLTVPRAASDRSADVAAQLMSPYCAGMTLATCPSLAAGELRHEITTRLERGENEDQIRESLIHRFGDRLRASPEPQGAGLLLWAIPLLGGVSMLGLLVTASGLRRARLPHPSEPRGDIDAALASRVEDELQQLV